jgi:hypothetical protein
MVLGKPFTNPSDFLERDEVPKPRVKKTELSHRRKVTVAPEYLDKDVECQSHPSDWPTQNQSKGQSRQYRNHHLVEQIESAARVSIESKDSDNGDDEFEGEADNGEGDRADMDLDPFNSGHVHNSDDSSEPEIEHSSKVDYDTNMDSGDEANLQTPSSNRRYADLDVSDDQDEMIDVEHENDIHTAGGFESFRPGYQSSDYDYQSSEQEDIIGEVRHGDYEIV